MKRPQIMPLVMGCFAVAVFANSATAGEFHINGHKFTTPDGFVVEQIASTALVKRPVSADFDERGRMYVTDSSGSNEPVAVQRKKRPHRIVRLEDLDGDGRFDKSTVYADKLMFPEGAQWFDGSLYVAAPPEIWKFTDEDDDGVAEKREVWFDGKTLTHCANDLHGPYLGPDGWMYWCKGAFASQTYERAGKSPLQTKAAHIFRRRPEGGPVEAVMTGGMDNPVEVIFTPGGERIFTTTFLVHPNQGQRDGLIHAIYGGVYGKDQNAIANHPRTGDLMPVLAHLGAAAPSGLARLESDGLGPSFRNNVLASSFNMHKITRHVLTKRGATFDCQTSNLLVSDNLDFHPTDVLEDADGSIVVVDTGGWFRLCCPTSQLEKPDVLGGIYRLRSAAAKPAADPRGRRIQWRDLGPGPLANLLGDPRPVVRRQSLQRLAKCGVDAVEHLQKVLTQSAAADHRLQAVWALTWIDGPQARAAVRRALDDKDETVRQAALHSTSVRRDKLAVDKLATLIKSGPAHTRRTAAEALGRVGSQRDIPRLLRAVAATRNREAADRCLEHSLIYAAMELDDPDTVRRKLISAPDDRVRRAALIALDQAEGGSRLQPDDIQALLTSPNKLLNETAWWIVKQHPDWGEAVVEAFRKELKHAPSEKELLQRLGDRLQRFSASKSVQQLVGESLRDADTSQSLRVALLRAMAASRQKPLPAVWAAALLEQLESDGSPETTLATLSALQQLGGGKLNAKMTARLRELAADEARTAETRLRSLNLLPPNVRRTTPAVLNFLCSQLTLESAIANRALAVDYLTSTPLDPKQLQQVARQLPQTGVMELQPLMGVFAKSKDRQVGDVLVAALLDAPAATSLFPDRLRQLVDGYGDSVASKAKPLLQKIEQENQNKLQRVEEILSLLPGADVRRGLRVFQSAKASCIACHRRGYLGGDIGPDLNRIGQIRSERAMVESVLFPSLSFVRSYEPVSMVLEDGRVLHGLIRGETDDVITLQIDAQKSMQIPKSAIEERHMGKLSIMPAGLEKQLSPQELADLVKYLKEG